MVGRAALEDQLRTVSEQLAESLASLGVMDSVQYLGTPLTEPMQDTMQQPTMAMAPAPAQTAQDKSTELLERIRELEVQTQTMQQQAGQGDTRRSLQRAASPRWGDNPMMTDRANRPAWGSPLGQRSPWREQVVEARARPGTTSPRRRSARSPGNGRSTTPTNPPPSGSSRTSATKKRPEANALLPKVAAAPSLYSDGEPLAGWGNTSDNTLEMTQYAEQVEASRRAAEVEEAASAGAAAAEPDDALSSASGLDTSQRRISELEVAVAAAASHAKVLEQQLVDKRTGSKTQRRGSGSASPGRRSPRRGSRSPKRAPADSPEEATRNGNARTSPGRDSVASSDVSFGVRTTKAGGGYGGEVILSRGSREEKERLMSQVAALQKEVDAERQLTLAEVENRQVAELKTQDAEGLSVELARALNVMTAHCEELERRQEAAAEQEAAVQATKDAKAAEVAESQDEEIDGVKNTEEQARSNAEVTLHATVDDIVAAAEGQVDDRLEALQIDMQGQITAIEEQHVAAREIAEAEFSTKITELESELARERGSRAAEKLEHDWAVEKTQEANVKLGCVFFYRFMLFFFIVLCCFSIVLCCVCVKNDRFARLAEKQAEEALAAAGKKIRGEVGAEAETQVEAAKAEAEAGWSELCDILGSQATEAMEQQAAAERTAREAELAVGQCEAKLSEQRQAIAGMQALVASISRVKEEAAAAHHERDEMCEQLTMAMNQTRALEVASQELVAEVQREARLNMASCPRSQMGGDESPGGGVQEEATGSARLAAHRAARAQTTPAGETGGLCITSQACSTFRLLC